MQRRRIFVVLVASALVAGLLYWRWQVDERAGDPGQIAAPSPEHSRGETSVIGQTAVRAAAVRVPLPPADVPVASLFNAMKMRADQGDALASCRLAVELIQCRDTRHMELRGAMGNLQSSESELSEAGNQDAADGVANFQLQLLAAREHCIGLTDDQLDLASGYLRKAAQAGIAEALVRYADGQGFPDTESMFGMLHDPDFEQWRREAPASLERALRQGDPAAAFLLYVAYSDDNSRLTGLIKNDAAHAASYRLLMARLRGKPTPALKGLTAAQLLESEGAATRMHQEYFDGAVLGPNISLTASLSSQLGPQTKETLARRPCE